MYGYGSSGDRFLIVVTPSFLENPTAFFAGELLLAADPVSRLVSDLGSPVTAAKTDTGDTDSCFLLETSTRSLRATTASWRVLGKGIMPFSRSLWNGA